MKFIYLPEHQHKKNVLTTQLTSIKLVFITEDPFLFPLFLTNLALCFSNPKQSAARTINSVFNALNKSHFENGYCKY